MLTRLTSFVLLSVLACVAQTTYQGTGSYAGQSIQEFQVLIPGGVYADPAGVDGLGCTQAQPCTLQGATDYIQAGGHGSIVVVKGTAANPYFLPSTWTFTAANSGTAIAPITFMAACYPTCTEATMPVISGGVRVPGTWTQDTSISCGTGCKWMRVSIDADPVGGSIVKFDGLFYNGQRRRRVRTTNSATYRTSDPANPVTVAAGSLALANTACACPDEDGNGTADTCALLQTTGIYACQNQFKFLSTNVPAGLKNVGIGDVEILDFEKSTQSTMRLKADPVGQVATVTGFTAVTSNQGWLPGNRFLVENVDPHDGNASNSPQLWYLDRCPTTASCTTPDLTQTLYYAQAQGEDVNSAVVIVPQIPTLLRMTGSSYVTFQSLSFAHDNWIPGQYGIGEQQGMPQVTGALELRDVSNVLFDGCVIAHTMGWAMDWQRQ